MLDTAVVYDVEAYPNCFTLTADLLNGSSLSTWEISHHRDDRRQLLTWFDWLHRTQTAMIGFNNLGYDYAVIHFIMKNPNCTVEQIRELSDRIIRSNRGNQQRSFEFSYWPRDRFAPQIDLMKVHHFDNKAKITGLKALQFNMRSESVMDAPIDFDTHVTADEVDRYVVPYNKHDVKETKRFAHISMGALEFRVALIPQFGVEVMNYNDTKIGEELLTQRLGDVCFTHRTYIDKWGNERTKREKRQTIRSRIALSDVIFPYVKFHTSEFDRVHQFMLSKVLTPADIDGDGTGENKVQTKGVISVSAEFGGLTWHFGTGGVHASVKAKRYVAGGGWKIRDIDVAALYPSLTIENKIGPEHLGEAFVGEYRKIRDERNLYAKGTYENASLKLANNGSWGKSNSPYSVFYDPQYSLKPPVNGQLLICMLAEWLSAVPTLSFIQGNTDGITYRIHEDYLEQAKAIEKQWEAFTCLKLEDADYSHMWIRDVNSYIARHTSGKLKIIGAYWTPDPLNYEASISNASPPAWHKDLSGPIVPRAAVAAMVHGVPPEIFIRACTNPFDFMFREKATMGAHLRLGSRKVQPTTRYYVSTNGDPMMKVMPAAGPLGQYKKAAKIDQALYDARMVETNGEWCETVCTKNKSKYEIRETGVQAGWKIHECNDATNFSFDNLNYEFYVQEARKLIIE